MPRRTTTRTAAMLATGAAAALVLGFAPAALATSKPASCIDATTVASLTDAGTTDALAGIDRCIAGLTKQAADASKVAQKADEAYLRARMTAATALVNAQRAASRASVAERRAEASRNRAAAVTAYLARTGQGDQATSVMLDGKSASKTLYTLSRVSQLTVDSSQIAAQAADDSAAAEQLGRQATVSADEAQRESDDASVAYDSAKHTAEAAALLVSQQVAQERALAAELGKRSVSAALKPVLTDLPPDATVAERVVAFARAQIGDPYVFAAAGPDAYDCSGLTMMAYAAAGIGIGGHSATAQYDLAAAQGKLVPYAQAQPGDLVFYSDGGGDMYHVAVYSGNGMMVEAPQEGEDVREVAVRTQDLVDVVARPSA